MGEREGTWERGRGTGDEHTRCRERVQKGNQVEYRRVIKWSTGG